jgi:hypothetical protein
VVVVAVPAVGLAGEQVVRHDAVAKLKSLAGVDDLGERLPFRGAGRLSDEVGNVIEGRCSDVSGQGKYDNQGAVVDSTIRSDVGDVGNQQIARADGYLITVFAKPSQVVTTTYW